MLAQDIIPLLQSSEAQLMLTDVSPGEISVALDIVNPKSVREVIREFEPQWVINCAAFTAVDDAEINQESAFAVNARGPGNIASAVKDIGGRLVHFSSDYVFGGEGSPSGVPFTEEDTPIPCGIYGQSKRYGDELVKSILPDKHLIIRPSWLHGINGPSFVATMLKLGKERESIKVVNDQIGSPTWSSWLANVVVQLMEREASGVFHATSKGNISWYDFAKEIFKQANIEVEVLPQSTEELNRLAPRPSYSTLSVDKLEVFLGKPCISWKQGLREHLEQLLDKG